MEMLAYCYLQTNEPAKAIAVLQQAIGYYENEKANSEKDNLNQITDFIRNNQVKKAGKILRKRF